MFLDKQILHVLVKLLKIKINIFFIVKSLPMVDYKIRAEMVRCSIMLQLINCQKDEFGNLSLLGICFND